MRLHGRRVVVTGASGLLGPRLVEALLALGAEVVGVARRKTRLEELRARFGHHERLEAAECDLADAEGLAALVASLLRGGPVHALVHAVGGYAAGPLESMPLEEVDRLLSQNLRSAVLAARAFAPAMLERGAGRIVLVAAEAALRPDPQAPLYAATKAAVLQLARSLDAAWGPRGLAVDAVCPGTLGEGPDRASPAAVARAVAWLLSEDAAGTGGSVLRVPGR